MEKEGRQKKVEAGKEKFAAYLKKKNAQSQSSDEKKEEKKNEAETKAGLGGGDFWERSFTASGEGAEISRSNDNQASSVETRIDPGPGGSSPYAGRETAEKLQSRVMELEDMLAGKETALEALQEELDAIKEISSVETSTGHLSFAVDFAYKNHVEEYHSRLLAFQEEVDHREKLIEQLSSSLQQAIQSRDALQLQGDHLVQEVALLQKQLKATTELVEGHQWDSGIKPQDYLALQNKMISSEDTITNQRAMIDELNDILKQTNTKLENRNSDLEKKSLELRQHKTTSANEIQQLMRDTEDLHQRAAITASSKLSLDLEYQAKMAALQAELEEGFGLQLVKIKEDIRNQFEQEKNMLLEKHTKETTLIQQSYDLYKDKVEALMLQLNDESSKIEAKHKNELAACKDSHKEELDLQNLEVESLMEQLKEVVDAKATLSVTLTALQKDHEQLKFTNEQTLTLLNEQLKEALQVQENNLQEIAATKQNYELQLITYKEQVDMLNLKLQDSSRTIEDLHAQISKCKTTYEAELENAIHLRKIEVESYQQKVKALNERLNEKYEAENNFPKVLTAHKQNYETQLANYTQEIQSLSKLLQQNEEMYKQELAKSNDIYEIQLGLLKQEINTLKSSYSETLNNKTRDDSERNVQDMRVLNLQLQESLALNVSYQKEESLYKRRNEVLNEKLLESRNVEDKHAEEILVCEAMLQKYKEQLELLSVQLSEEVIKGQERHRKELTIREEAHDKELALLMQQLQDLNAQLHISSHNEETNLQELNCYKQEVTALNTRLLELLEVEENFTNKLTLSKQAQETELMSNKKQMEFLTTKLNEANTKMQSMSEKQAMWETYKTKLDQSEQQTILLQSKLEEKQVEVSTIISTLEACKTEVNVLKGELHCLTGKYKVQAVELETGKNTVETLNEQLGEFKLVTEAQAKDILVYQKQIEILSSKVMDTTEEAKISNLKASSCKAELTKYEEQLKVLEEAANMQESYKDELDLCKHEIKNLHVQLNEKLIVMEGHAVEIETYQKKIELLKMNLDESSKEEEVHMLELTTYKEEVDNLKMQLQKSSSKESKLQQLVETQASLSEQLSMCHRTIEELNMQINVHNQEEHNIAEFQEKINTSNNHLRESEVIIEKQKLDLYLLEDNLAICTKEVESLRTQLNDMLVLRESQDSEISAYQQQIELLSLTLHETTQYNDNNVKELLICKNEIDQYKSDLNSYKSTNEELTRCVQIAESENGECKFSNNTEIYKLKLEVNNLNDIILQKTEAERISTQEVISYQSKVHQYETQIKELHTQKELWLDTKRVYDNQLSDLQGKLLSVTNEISNFEIQIKSLNATVHLKTTSEELLQSELEDAAIQILKLQTLNSGKDEIEDALHKRIQELEAILVNVNEKVHVQSLKLEVLLSGKEEIENALNKRIQELEVILIKMNEESDHMNQENSQLQEMAVQCLRVQSLLSAKEEVEHSLNRRIQELESTLNKSFQDKQETDSEKKELILKLVRAKELLKKFKTEQGELITKCKQLEENLNQCKLEKELFIAEKADNSKLVENLNLEIKKLKQELANNKVLEANTSPLHSKHILSPVFKGGSSVETSLESKFITFDGTEHSIVMLEPDGMRSQNNDNHTQYTEGKHVKTVKVDASKESQESEALGILKWMDQSNRLEEEKLVLVNEIEILQGKLKEKQLHESILNAQIAATTSQCKKLEQQQEQLTKSEVTIQNLLQIKHELELKMGTLISENKRLQDTYQDLQQELLNKQLLYEDKMHLLLQEQLLDNAQGKNNTIIEQLILDSGSKAKELIIQREKIRSQEQFQNNKIHKLEETNIATEMILNSCQREKLRIQADLEGVMEKDNDKEDEIEKLNNKLVLLMLEKEQLEASNSRILDNSTNNDLSLMVKTREETLHKLVESLVLEVASLKEALHCEQNRNEELNLELQVRVVDSTVKSNPVDNSSMEVHHKLELILKSNTELVTEKEVLLVKLHKLQEHIENLQELEGIEQMKGCMLKLADHESNLMTELAAYREQHASLAELLGSTGILQETLYRQKQELLLKFREKAAIEKTLEEERVTLKNTQIKLRMMEHQLVEKENIYQKLNTQKCLLETSLHEIEGRLRDQEEKLLSQKLSLEGEIRIKDLHIKHWQLEFQTKQVDASREPDLVQHDEQLMAEHSVDLSRVDTLKQQLDAAHAEAVSRLRDHLQQEFALKEAEFQQRFALDLATIQHQHEEQIMSIQEKLNYHVKEYESVICSEMLGQFDVTNVLAGKLKLEEMAKIKENHKKELEDIKNNIAEKEMKIYSELKDKFENYSNQEICFALKTLKEEHELAVKERWSIMNIAHNQELQALQAKLESEKQIELLTVKQALAKLHKDEISNLNQMKYNQWTHELENVTEQNSANLQHVKQLTYINYMISVKELFDNWKNNYSDEIKAVSKQIQEAFQKNMSFPRDVKSKDPSAVINNEQDINTLLKTKEMFLQQIQFVQSELAEHHREAVLGLQTKLDEQCSKAVDQLQQLKQATTEAATIASLQDQLARLDQEKQHILNNHRDFVSNLTHEHKEKIEKLHGLMNQVMSSGSSGLAELRMELEVKHAKEMEELRQYFEQKCADVEKHYSEEVFSQHSRKMSESSCGSGGELVSDLFLTGTDQRVTPLTHICDSYTAETSLKDLEEQYRNDFEKRLVEYQDQLELVKAELEQKYQNELGNLRDEYKLKVEDLIRDLTSSHQLEVQSMQTKHEAEMENLRTSLLVEATGIDSTNNRAVNDGLLQEFKKELQNMHMIELMELKEWYELKVKSEVEAGTCKLQQEEREHASVTQSDLQEVLYSDVHMSQESFSGQFIDRVSHVGSKSAIEKIDLELEIRERLKQELDDERQKKLAEINENHEKELRDAIAAEKKLLTQQFDELVAFVKKNAEEEQDKFMKNQKEMMSNFLKQHKEDMHILEMQHGFQEAMQEGARSSEAQELQVQAEHKQQLGTQFREDPTIVTMYCGTEKLNSQICEKYEKVSFELDSQETEQLSPKELEGHKINVAKDKQRKERSVQLDNPEYNKLLAELRVEMDNLRALHAEELNEEREKLKQELIKEHLSKLQALSSQFESAHKKKIEELEKILMKRHEEDFLQLQNDFKEKALLAEDSEDIPRPKELIDLQEKFAARYKYELDVLKEAQKKEIAKIRSAYETELLSGAEKYSQQIRMIEERVANEEKQCQLEQTKRALQAKLGEDVNKNDCITILNTDLNQIIQERDNFKKMTSTLKYLVSELAKYFTVCEEELNNTLVEELLKCELGYDNEKGLSMRDNEEVRDNVSLDMGDTSIANTSTVQQELDSRSQHGNTSGQVRRVHFAPDVSGFIDDDSFLELIDANKDLSADFRNELDSCLERLKSEAASLLGMSTNLSKPTHNVHKSSQLLQEKIKSLTEHLNLETKTKDEIIVQLCVTKSLSEGYKEEVQTLQQQLACLKASGESLTTELQVARDRITELQIEAGKREIVTEGFGENVQLGLSRTLDNLAQLQDKARCVLNSDDSNSPHFKLIEELCREGDLLSEEARKEREDLEQQVEAADKQLRSTRQFLEDQATEREQERDDFLKEIARLGDLLRERERGKIGQQNLTKEDALEAGAPPCVVYTVEALELQIKESSLSLKGAITKKEELETELKAAIDKVWTLREIIRELESTVEAKTQHEVALEHHLCELQGVLEDQSKSSQELVEQLDSLRENSGSSVLTEKISYLEEQLLKHRLHVEQFQSNSLAVRQMKGQLRDLEAALDKKTKDLEAIHVTVSSMSCSSPSEDVSIREHLDAFRCDTPEDQRTQSPVCLPLDEVQRLYEKLQKHSRVEEVTLKRIRDLEMQLKNIRRNEEEVTGERDVLQERVEVQLLQISSLQSRLDEQRRKVDTGHLQVASELQARLQGTVDEANSLRDAMDQRERELKEVNALLDQARRALQAQDKEERDTIQQLQTESQSLKAENNRLQVLLAGQNVSIPMLMDTMLADKNAEIDDLQGQLNQYKSQHAPPDSKIHMVHSFGEPEQYRATTAVDDHFLSRGSIDLLLNEQKQDLVQLGASELSSQPRSCPGDHDSIDSDLQHIVREKDAQIASLKKLLAERTKKTLADMEQELAKKNKQLAKYEASQAEVPGLQHKIQDLEERLSESMKLHQDKLDAAAASHKLLTMSLEQMRKQLAEKQDQSHVLQSKLAETVQVVQKLGEEKQLAITSLEKLEETQSGQIAVLTEQLHEEREGTLKLQREFEMSRDDLQVQSDCNKTLQGQVQEQKKYIIKLKEVIKARKEKLCLQEADKEALERQVQEQERCILELKKEVEGKKDEFQEQVERNCTQEVELEEQRKSVMELGNKIEATLKWLSVQEERNRALEEEVRVQEEASCALRSEVRENKEKLQMECERNQALQQEMQGQQEVIKTLQNEVNQLQKENSKLAQEYQTLLDEAQDRPGSLDDLTDQVKRELDLSAQLDHNLLDKLVMEKEDLEKQPPNEQELDDTLLPPQLLAILQKIMSSGMTLLTLPELSYMHKHIGNATSSLVGAAGDGNWFDSDPLATTSHITTLENQISTKQEETLKKLIELEAKVEQEEMTNLMLTRALQEEKRKNAERVKEHAESVATLEFERNSMKDASAQQEECTQHLMLLLKQGEEKVDLLSRDLQEERRKVKELTKCTGSDFIELMRLKLETALDNENKLRFRVEQERKLRDNLEREFELFQRSVQTVQQTTRASSSSDLQKKAEHKERLEVEVTSKQSQLNKENNEDLQTQQKLELEKQITRQLRKDIIKFQDQQDSLNIQLDSAKEDARTLLSEVESLRTRVHLLQELDSARQKMRKVDPEIAKRNKKVVEDAQSVQLYLEQMVKKLEEQDKVTKESLGHIPSVTYMSDEEQPDWKKQVPLLKHQLKLSIEEKQSLRQELTRLRMDLFDSKSVSKGLEIKTVELRQRLEVLKQELENVRLREIQGQQESTSVDLEKRIRELGHQMDVLKQNLEESKQREQLLMNELSKEQKELTSGNLPETFLVKLKNLNLALEDHLQENRTVSQSFSRLNEERQRDITRINELEEQLRKSTNQDVERLRAQLISERAVWAEERAALQLSRPESVRSHRSSLAPPDMEERVRHLFGKFLRSESYRKALVWQKRYLLVLLGGYQNTEAVTISRLAHLTGLQETLLGTKVQRKPRARFRLAVTVVIAVLRMQYLVQRWRHGSRVGGSAVFPRAYAESVVSSNHSSYHGAGPRRSTSSTSSRSLPQGLLSPPSRDQPMLRRWQQEGSQHHWRSIGSSQVTGLQPNQLVEYIDRFDQLQQRLGLTNPPHQH